MACTTVSSEGVPPKAGTSPDGGAASTSPVGSSVAGSISETTCAVLRVSPATDQSTGVTVLLPVSTLGTILHWPARRSEPNQVTTSETAAHFGSRGGQLLQAVDEIRHAVRRMDVLRVPGSEAVRGLVHLGSEHELAGTGQERDGAQRVDDVVGVRNGRRAHEFRRDLRHPIAEVVEGHLLEHDVAEAPVGRHRAGTFHRLDEAVRQLSFGAVVERVGESAEVEFVAVGPNAAQRDVVAAFAERDRE